MFITATKKSIPPANATTLILPTLNEAKSIQSLLRKAKAAAYLSSVIVVDDGSSDGTAEIVKQEIGEKVVFVDRSENPVKGLTASLLDAIRLVKTPFFVIMDADGQHPFETVEPIIAALQHGADLAIANRHEVEDGWSWHRQTLSRLGSLLGKLSLSVRRRNYWQHDILSGFVGAKTTLWLDLLQSEPAHQRFQLHGYKLLFDFLKIAPKNLIIARIPYCFATRKADQSKINLKTYSAYLRSLW